ncbi:MAG: GFA family protein [Cognatishimia sp.]|uniref:GFA family protein n=1 Tax=Cognatishimia sp. TaxID=2211648 RepID=UPI003B8BFE0A
MSYRLTCHCGAVEMDVTLSEGLETARRCDCSYCRRRGAIAVSAPVEGGVKILKGADNLSLYQWGTGIAKHYFCKTCGIYTHHQRRSDPSQYGINVACLEGINPRDLGDVPWMDGTNHPKDRA